MAEEDTSISGLPETTLPAPTDVIPVVSGGATKKVQLQNITTALKVATSIDNGLLSAADKSALDQALVDVSDLLAPPVVQTIPSASNITINDGTDVVVLTGTTNVTTVNTPNEYKLYTVHYPTGSGLTFLGTPLVAGSAVLTIGVET